MIQKHKLVELNEYPIFHRGTTIQVHAIPKIWLGNQKNPPEIPQMHPSSSAFTIVDVSMSPLPVLPKELTRKFSKLQNYSYSTSGNGFEYPQ